MLAVPINKCLLRITCMMLQKKYQIHLCPLDAYDLAGVKFNMPLNQCSAEFYCTESGCEQLEEAEIRVD